MSGVHAHGFALIQERELPEIRSRVRLYRHERTGARYLSLTNDDENKVFGVSFRTPPSDSTGVAHILEHSVLCGSRKYPIKEPFVELLKGSMKTFLNAFTFPDKTCYPVASTNLRDFYNLMDVYLDAVFFPRLTEAIFKQEGWHYEAESFDGPLSYKGVVYNEMRGAYSSPDSLLHEYTQRSVFPDTTYGLDSGGDPRVIPQLTFEQFMDFHRTYYHPSNAWFYAYGDDPEEERLARAAEYIDEFEAIEPGSDVPLQPKFGEPREITEYYAAGQDSESKAMVTVNWLLPETFPEGEKAGEVNLLFNMLEHLLIGLPASPLRKALIESGLGDDLAGVGLEADLRQMYFSTGLKGVDPDEAEEVQAVIEGVLRDIAENGAPKNAVEAAFNSVEFELREQNTGSFPRGLYIMVRTLSGWLYDKDPVEAIAFEDDLASLRKRLDAGEPVFENVIRTHFLDNTHRTRVTLLPDKSLAEKRLGEEAAELQAVQERLGREGMERVIEEAEELERLQAAPDSPEALATIPRLQLKDLDKENRIIPMEEKSHAGATILEHELDARGIVYLDLAFDLLAMPDEYVPFVTLFGRALLEMGTQRRDFVDLGMQIASRTGGIDAGSFTATIRDTGRPSAQFLLRGKATEDKAGDLADILREVLTEPNFSDRKRFKQIVLEEKARLEHRLVPAGHMVVANRLMARFSPAGLMDERMSGVSQLFFLRELSKKVDTNWDEVHACLEAMHDSLIRRKTALANVTAEAGGLAAFEPLLKEILDAVVEDCDVETTVPEWLRQFGETETGIPDTEGLAIPAQVNYVGKAMDLAALGYKYHGSANVASKYLRNGFLWDRIRVQGGAYGAFTMLDRMRGVLAFCSYRDPNLERTLEVYDESARHLAGLEMSEDARSKAIIGAISDIDAYMLPDAKGYASMARYLTGDTDELRQQMREEILNTTVEDMRRFGEVVVQGLSQAKISVLGDRNAIESFCVEQGVGTTKLL
ncbi:peptidase M16 [Oceanidesulfovibrio indonesiensis]|uniref:Peptidase M16 n=1 Tax=Oceanidesulfovibrio indonesiensis TaxID=54767 RepID=A0A7M3MCU3_9BACT|nr:insulinase family protein [Oceanidesulfovibrio indonesiensis]TVM16285.1 peptidase M16 [Oceanidesulfovibrio indonesiensis]